MTSINGRDLVLLLDSVDRSDEASSVSFGIGTRTTFADMRNAVPKVLNMTIKQDLDADSLYTLALAGLGEPIVGLVKPNGNETASATQPHYSFNVTPAGPSSDSVLGGDAADDASKPLTVDVAWLITDWLKVAGA